MVAHSRLQFQCQWNWGLLLTSVHSHGAHTYMMAKHSYALNKSLKSWLERDGVRWQNTCLECKRPWALPSKLIQLLIRGPHFFLSYSKWLAILRQPLQRGWSSLSHIRDPDSELDCFFARFSHSIGPHLVKEFSGSSFIETMGFLFKPPFNWHGGHRHDLSTREAEAGRSWVKARRA